MKLVNILLWDCPSSDVNYCIDELGILSYQTAQTGSILDEFVDI